MGKIKKEEVETIAQLARLKLSDKEIENYQSEMSAILEYVETINELDTSRVAPTAQVTGLTDVVRSDEKVPSDLSRDEIFSNAPDKRDGYIKVKAVLD